MLRLLSDENFNCDIVRGLLLRDSKIDLIRIQDIGMQGSDDESVLAWAAENNRILLTHDRATMPDFAYARVKRGHPCLVYLFLMIAFLSNRLLTSYC